MKNGDKFSKISSAAGGEEGLFSLNNEIKPSGKSDKEILPSVENDMLKKLKEMIQLMLSEGITEIDIKEGDFSIYVKRRSLRCSNIPAVSNNEALLLNGSVSPATNNNSSKADEFADKRRITSPINGVFYRASSPKSPPFVSEGDVVDSGKTLCIIEAMKVMNEIKADSRMKILKILVENGKSVTQGEPIFIVE